MQVTKINNDFLKLILIFPNNMIEFDSYNNI